MNKTNHSYSFLVVGKTQESKDATESFKRYIGIGVSKVLAVNPNKAELEKIYGREIANDPDYTTERNEVKGHVVDIIIQTDPDTYGEDSFISHARFNIFPEPAYNKDKSKVRVVDNYGNSKWMITEDAKAGKNPGENIKMDSKYRIAFSGEVELLDFLRKYLYNEDTFEMPNGTWTKKKNADDHIIGFEDPKKLLDGNVSEIKELIALQPSNKIKLLYGVKTSENQETGKITYRQTVCTSYEMMLRNNSGVSAYNKLEKDLNNAKQSGLYSNVEYKVQDLAEWTVEPTNLDKPAEKEDDTELPW